MCLVIVYYQWDSLLPTEFFRAHPPCINQSQPCTTVQSGKLKRLLGSRLAFSYLNWVDNSINNQEILRALIKPKLIVLMLLQCALQVACGQPGVVQIRLSQPVLFWFLSKAPRGVSPNYHVSCNLIQFSIHSEQRRTVRPQQNANLWKYQEERVSNEIETKYSPIH